MGIPAIRVEGLGKKYTLAHQAGGRGRYQTLRESLAGGVATVANRVRGRAAEGTREEFWALKDVSFEVQPGEVVGIIGRNGAGKSTLLKVLSRITKPTTGRAVINGRVGSLLEVGTGFHPELTGRENVYLNGSILGMSRREIERKFDEIVAFAEVEKFLDTPVKRYSSGMYVRLAFAVAAHLEPEILIVDEVLAVGDAGFQQRCLDKMRQCASSGRTVLLVSHQMNSVRDLCNAVIWLDSGGIRMAGSVATVIEEYLTDTGFHVTPGDWIDLTSVPRSGRGPVRLHSVMCCGATPNTPPVPDGPFQLTMQVDVPDEGASHGMLAEFQLLDRYQNRLVVVNTYEGHQPLRLQPGRNRIAFAIEQLHLAPGVYTVSLTIGDVSDFHDVVSNAIQIQVVPIPLGERPAWSGGSVVTRAYNCVVQATAM